MDQRVALVLCLPVLALCAPAAAQSRASIGYGITTEQADAFRVGIQQPLKVSWLDGRLVSYGEGSVSYWYDDDEAIHAVALAPVLVYRFCRRPVSPYIEVGLGATYVTAKHISARDLSTHFLFEDRVGIGIMGDVHNVGFKVFHYSNARIKQPNDGINVFLLCYTFSR